MSGLGDRIIADGPFGAGGATPGWLMVPVASAFNELRDELIYLRGPRSFVPVPTDEMVQAFNDADFSGCGNADWEDSHVRIGLTAVLAIVERDLVIEASGRPADAPEDPYAGYGPCFCLGCIGGGPCEHLARPVGDTEGKS